MDGLVDRPHMHVRTRSLGGLGDGTIFVVGARGQKNPECVDAERCSDWNAQERHEAHYQRNRASPVLALQQSPTGEKSGGGFCQDEPSEKAD